MKQFLISKYDKARRDEDGVYREYDQWTESSDIGRTVAGKKLRVREYLEVESKYIDAVVRHFQISGLDHLRLTCAHLNKWQMSDLRNRRPELHELAFFDVDFTEDAIISFDQIPTYIKMILRNLGEGKLEFAERFFVHFGWDLYMYLGTDAECEIVNQEIEKNGLFVLERDSPYKLRDVGGWKLKIERSDIVEDIVDCDFGIEIDNRELQNLRAIWGFSREHPFIGNWGVLPEHIGRLSALSDHKFDFANFRYWLNTDDEDRC